MPRVTYTSEDVLALIRQQVLSIEMCPRDEDAGRLHPAARWSKTRIAFLDSIEFSDWAIEAWFSETQQILPQAQLNRAVRLLSAQARRGAA